MTAREEMFDNRVTPAADRINGTIPGRTHKDGRPVQVMMEDVGYSKADGAWTNGILGDLAVLGNRILSEVTGAKQEQQELAGDVEALRVLIVNREAADLDPAAVAAQVLHLLPDTIAEDVVTAMGRQLGGGDTE